MMNRFCHILFFITLITINCSLVSGSEVHTIRDVNGSPFLQKEDSCWISWIGADGAMIDLHKLPILRHSVDCKISQDSLRVFLKNRYHNGSYYGPCGNFRIHYVILFDHDLKLVDIRLLKIGSTLTQTQQQSVVQAIKSTEGLWISTHEFDYDIYWGIFSVWGFYDN